MTRRVECALLAGLVTCVSATCAPAPGAPPPAGHPAQVVIASGNDAGAPSCSERSSLHDVAAVDFSADPMDDERKTRVRAALLASIGIRAVDASWEITLGDLCARVGAALALQNTSGAAVDRCERAIEAVEQARASAGGSLRASLAPPTCFAPMPAAADCAAVCDPRVDVHRISVACERGSLVGTCGGQCRGLCDSIDPVACQGTCSGSCDAGFRGSCAGTCRGRCDGRALHEHCSGTCEGACDAVARGVCTGGCVGRCELDKNGTCGGLCVGSCDRPLDDLHCTGDIKASNVSGPCTAGCRVWLESQSRCLAGFADVELVGAHEHDAATLLLRTVGPNLEPASRIPMGMKARVQIAIGQLRALVEAAEAHGPLSPCFRLELSEGLRAASRLEAKIAVADRLMAVMIGG